MEKINLKLMGENDFCIQESFKVLRTNLQFCGKDIHTIAFTSCRENEGKTTVVLNLGQSLAELGKRVLIIDADMRKSVMAGRNSTAKNAAGLSEVLTGMQSWGTTFMKRSLNICTSCLPENTRRIRWSFWVEPILLRFCQKPKSTMTISW